MPRCSASRTAICRRRRAARSRTASFAELQEAFITMAANLREAHAALDRQIEQERKMRETLQSLQRQVVRQERLAAVGVLVSGVAHELNNPAAGDPRHRGTARAASRAVGRSDRGAGVRQDAERSRPRDHPQPVAIQQPAVGAADARRSGRGRRRGGAAAPPRSRQLVDRARRPARSARQGLRKLHRSRAGDAEFRDQRAAVDRNRRAARTDRILIRVVRRRQESPARSAGRWARRVGGGRAEAVPAVLHHQTGGQGHRPRPVGELRHHRILRRRHRPSRQRMGRRHVLLRAAGERAGRPSAVPATRTNAKSDDRPPLLQRSVSRGV